MTVIDIYFAVLTAICVGSLIVALVGKGIERLEEWWDDRREAREVVTEATAIAIAAADRITRTEGQ